MTNNIHQAAGVIIESLDQDGRGIAHADGKVVFIEGALTGERVTYNAYRKKPSYELAKVDQILRQSFMRVQPKCVHFDMCGGCSMQHLDARAQVAAKQRILEDNLERIGKVKAETIMPPIYGQTWGYRQRARLSVRHVIKKGKTLVGFHEKSSRYVADMQHCEILPPKIANLLPLLAKMNEGLSIRDDLPQIEVAVGEHVDVLVLRIMKPLSNEDEATIKQFADTHQVQFWLQTKGPETVVPFYPLDAPALSYSLPEFGITMPFSPTDFTQVNSSLNRLMMSRAMRLLSPRKGERIADFFCGLGNFTLPIARSGAEVIGIEGSASLLQRAAQNAASNGLEANTRFSVMNLFEMNEETLAKLGHFDKMLIDPPRDGAFELVKALGADAPQRIVYVSCNPATLARDAEVLVHQKGYVLKAAGVMNMFPHTSHVESIALFERQ
ncbi:MAG: 23S rRNA (uracil(1939)-C(5))-methyltransferase [Gallionellales bacterium 35-53-114]|jgi:23S rRNA (uracil1939-C5)-methyltransferase|nr:MAG: 23S rRNA (uracil(1939)-C(5))-methyltransferase [Gallionellales bacterium 35-53-114]OYZ65313.1 MAG: 23S rRNA (uracil(1939)-C(5))-methyltransferase [Gallionellales bacterium 24-53-125]OZB08220.1 MAG: 23S rRNA (uracil(1939)-C(5))-methyltransferase [Gallionellales bacterium 39-52-133]HQS58150.1 23S rRNA (uracil(1939)-C(5))-methyltransferase RlmD [Gallionellaceae bacterium]HQS73705.1 23S rRNA (uracil(1939)-C(5))-methyltransferase RlmD [Gallionellaceae bacterium]